MSDRIVHKSDKVIQKSDKVVHESDKVVHESDKVVHESDKVAQKSDKVVHKSDKVVRKSDNIVIEIVNDADVKRLLKRDKLFAAIRKQYGIPPNWSREPGFVSLSKIILEQQVSLASANAHFRKLLDHIGDFHPANILRLTDEEMRACQISRQKMVYLRALSEAVVAGKLDILRLGLLTEPEVRERLTGIKGIGHWTTDVYLLFCLQAKDIFPIGDIAIVNTMRELTDAKTQEEMLAMAEGWRPLRSLAAYFLWHYYLKKRNRS